MVSLTDKSFFDHVSDWFRILLKSGVPALLIGLGFVLVFVCSVYLGSSWTTNAGSEVGAGTGIMMILLGAWLYKRELDSLPAQIGDSLDEPALFSVLTNVLRAEPLEALPTLFEYLILTASLVTVTFL